MAVNEATLNLITEFEGFVPKWYPDPAHGWKVPTCCYGHTDAAGEPKYAADKARKFTKAEGREILRRDLAAVEATVSRLVKVPVDENQRGALVSFTFNLGEGNFKKSTLLKKLNAKDYAGATGEFKRWNRAGGKVLAGLTRRRAAEAALFAAPLSGTTTPPKPETPPDEARRPVRDILERLRPVTDADELESVSQQLKDLLPQQKGRPMRNWLTGFVATTGFKYLVAAVSQYLAVKLGVEEGELTGIILQLVTVAMGAWGMHESSKSKIIMNGVKQSIPNDATPAEAKGIAAVVIGKAEAGK